MCNCADSPLRTTIRRCVYSAGSVARSSTNIILRTTTCKKVWAPVFSVVLLCVFDMTRVCWVQHWYAATLYLPSPGMRTSLRAALWVIIRVRILSAAKKNAVSLNRGLPHYWYNIESPIGRSIRPNSNGAVEYSVHYALFGLHYSNQTYLYTCLAGSYIRRNTPYSRDFPAFSSVQNLALLLVILRYIHAAAAAATRTYHKHAYSTTSCRYKGDALCTRRSVQDSRQLLIAS